MSSSIRPLAERNLRYFPILDSQFGCIVVAQRPFGIIVFFAMATGHVKKKDFLYGINNEVLC